MNKDRKKNNKDIRVILTYKPSQEANFRLSQALKMLIGEDDLLNKELCQQKKKRLTI